MATQVVVRVDDKGTMAWLRGLPKKMESMNHELSKKFGEMTEFRVKNIIKQEVSSNSLAGFVQNEVAKTTKGWRVRIHMDGAQSGKAWERGFAPHVVTRDMKTDNGRSLSDVLDVFKNNPEIDKVMVGVHEPAISGVHMFERAFDRSGRLIYPLIDKGLNSVFKGGDLF